MISELKTNQLPVYCEETPRKLGNVLVGRNSDLGYTHYVVDCIPGPLEIFLTDELRTAGLPFKNLKEIAISEMERVRNDPFGETSVDPHVLKDFARLQRSINSLKQDVQRTIGLPIAIKGSIEPDEDPCLEREDLLDQFLFMRELQVVSQERLTDEQRQIIEFLPVYGAIRVGRQDFLIMKYIEGASEVEDKAVPFLNFGWMGSGDPDIELALPTSENEGLLNVLGFRSFPELIRYRYIANAFSDLLGIPLNDLAGRNILRSQNGGSRKYVIIDQVR